MVKISMFEQVFIVIPAALAMFIAKDVKVIHSLFTANKLLFNVFGKMIAMYGNAMSMQGARKALGSINAQFLNFVMIDDANELSEVSRSIYVKSLMIRKLRSNSAQELQTALQCFCEHPPPNLQHLEEFSSSVFKTKKDDASQTYTCYFSKFARLQSLVFYNDFKTDSISSNWFPPNLTLLHFGDIFNQKLTAENLQQMPYLTTLIFGYHFDQELPIIPESVKNLTLGKMFSHHFDNVSSNLETLTLSCDFDVDKQLLPSNLQKLILYGSKFTFGQNKFPASLRHVFWPLTQSLKWRRIIDIDATVQHRLLMISHKQFQASIELCFTVGQPFEIAAYFKLCDDANTLYDDGAPLMHFLAQHLTKSSEDPHVYTKV